MRLNYTEKDEIPHDFWTKFENFGHSETDCVFCSRYNKAIYSPALKKAEISFRQFCSYLRHSYCFSVLENATFFCKDAQHSLACPELGY